MRNSVVARIPALKIPKFLPFYFLTSRLKTLAPLRLKVANYSLEQFQTPCHISPCLLQTLDQRLQIHPAIYLDESRVSTNSRCSHECGAKIFDGGGVEQWSWTSRRLIVAKNVAEQRVPICPQPRICRTRKPCCISRSRRIPSRFIDEECGDEPPLLS